jgi:hypothetical protein
MLLELMMGFQHFVSAWNRLIFLGMTGVPPRLSPSRTMSDYLCNLFDFPRQQPNALLCNAKLLRLLIHWITLKMPSIIELYNMWKQHSDTDVCIRLILLLKVRLSKDKAPAQSSSQQMTTSWRQWILFSLAFRPLGLPLTPRPSR